MSPDGYFTLPSLALDCCLKVTKASIELVQDIEMHGFIESSKRGGMCAVSQRLATTGEGRSFLEKIDPNLQKMTTHLQERDRNNEYILDLDMNNLYGRYIFIYIFFYLMN